MNRILLLLLTLALSLVPILCWATEPSADQPMVIAEIEKMGGKVRVDEKSPGKAVVGVDLGNSQVTDAALVHLKGLTQLQSLCLYRTQVTDAGLVHLRGLTRLQSLNLATPQVTDAGLVHLEGLTQLQSLVVGGTQVTDAGLVHLRGLTRLQTLTLDDTNVSDAGLVHLKGMTQLQGLSLLGTKVTYKGGKQLQQVLPKCSIRFGRHGGFGGLAQ